MHIINSIFLYLGMNSLMYAAKSGNTDIVRILLFYGADVHAMDEYGKLYYYCHIIYPYIYLCI